jgi:hypothetical protein
MSHVLQRVVDNTNVPADKKTMKGNWGSATKTMFKIDNKYYMKWSDLETTTEVYNHDISQESQAEGISYDIFTTVYNMSDIQKQLIWEGMFGRLNKYRDKYDESLNAIANKNKGFDLATIDTKIYTDIISQLDPMNRNSEILYTANRKLGNLPAYGGYLHPREPKDMPALWEYLK